MKWYAHVAGAMASAASIAVKASSYSLRVSLVAAVGVALAFAGLGGAPVSGLVAESLYKLALIGAVGVIAVAAGLLPGLRLARPEPADLCLLENVVAGKDLVRTFSRKHNLEAGSVNKVR